LFIAEVGDAPQSFVGVPDRIYDWGVAQLLECRVTGG
jgi:hypothetical protein